MLNYHWIHGNALENPNNINYPRWKKEGGDTSQKPLWIRTLRAGMVRDATRLDQEQDVDSWKEVCYYLGKKWGDSPRLSLKRGKNEMPKGKEGHIGNKPSSSVAHTVTTQLGVKEATHSIPPRGVTGRGSFGNVVMQETHTENPAYYFSNYLFLSTKGKHRIFSNHSK